MRYGSINLLSYGNVQKSVMPIESSNIAHELINSTFKFLFGRDTYASRYYFCSLRKKKSFNQVKPGTMLRSRDKFKAIRHSSKVLACFFGDMSRMIIQNNTNFSCRRILFIYHFQKLQETSIGLAWTIKSVELLKLTCARTLIT